MPYLTPDILPSTLICRRLLIPDAPGFRRAVYGALLELTYNYNWEDFGSVSTQSTIDAFGLMLDDFLQDSGCDMIGQIAPYIRTTAPDSWLLCDGTQYLRTDYPDLYALLPVSFQIDANNFIVPDMRGRFLLGADATYLPEAIGGEIDHVLTAGELPIHTHTAQPHNHNTDAHDHVVQPHNHTSPPHGHTSPPHGHTYNQFTFGIDIESVGVPDPTGVGQPAIPQPTSLDAVTVNNSVATVDNATVDVDPATVVVQDETVVVDNTGNDEAHNNMPPYYAIDYFIKARY